MAATAMNLAPRPLVPSPPRGRTIAGGVLGKVGGPMGGRMVVPALARTCVSGAVHGVEGRAMEWSIKISPGGGHAMRRRRICAHAGAPTDGTSPPTAKSVTQEIMERMDADKEGQTGGAGGSTTWEGLLRAEEGWARMRASVQGAPTGPRPEVVVESNEPLTRPIDVDVVVAGGTLGIFLACTLQLRGWRVAVVERGVLRGRAQEWNISRHELQGLVEMGLLTEEELEVAIQCEWNPVRCSFHGGEVVEVEDVLNIGVSPMHLIDAARRRFEAEGGRVLEHVGVDAVVVKEEGAEARLSNGETLTCRLVVDAMGHFSPIVRQIRWGDKPDGVCMVVGSCARGFDPGLNTTSDLLWTTEDMREVGEGKNLCQYFWEAFPAGSGPGDRTTYMFTYLDADPSRHTLLEMLEDYWAALPGYQGVRLGDLEVLRVLFGFFPTFKGDSPLPPAFDRVIQVGDASGIQSPLSFGGFGSIVRHLGRLTGALSEALEGDLLTRGDLRGINVYQPNLGTAWMNQKAMGARVGQKMDPGTVNRLLDCNFGVMRMLGPRVMRPFLQDVTQLLPLAATMCGMMLRRPFIAIRTLGHVGPGPFFGWFVHFHMLAFYTVAHYVVGPLIRVLARLMPVRRLAFMMRRTAEAFEYGAGLDHGSGPEATPACRTA